MRDSLYRSEQKESHVVSNLVNVGLRYTDRLKTDEERSINTSKKDRQKSFSNSHVNLRYGCRPSKMHFNFKASSLLEKYEKVSST